MAEPIVFISRWRVADRDAWARAYRSAYEGIGTAKPRTALFAAYLDEGGTETRIVHAFPDAAAVSEHFEGSASRSASVADLLVPGGFELYGPAPADAVDQLRRAADASGTTLERFPEAIAGFVRAPR
jgi:hypothetical protein